ncbi:MAG: hypothetical protein AB2L11_06040 [Syntrophobacteraceae bacterium]
MDRLSLGSVHNEEEALDPEATRVDRADELCCRACTEAGVKVSSWEDFVAWQKYVDGSIGESQLSEEAREEVEQFAKSFGKYVVIKKEETTKESKEEAEKKERIRRANKIYRKVCSDAGLNVHFFHDFTSWSGYVNGQISESDFYEKALIEVKEIAGKAEQS